jgi:hypothetical protein
MHKDRDRSRARQSLRDLLRDHTRLANTHHDDLLRACRDQFDRAAYARSIQPVRGTLNGGSFKSQQFLYFEEMVGHDLEFCGFANNLARTIKTQFFRVLPS